MLAACQLITLPLGVVAMVPYRLFSATDFFETLSDCTENKV
jgi:hypothetical protein